jgi:septal ring factor EnvC (AmiA/AmiB activator)
MMWLTSFFARSIFGISYKAIGTIILLASMLGYRYYLVHALEGARNEKQAVLQQLADYKAAIKAETALQEKKNAENKAASQEALRITIQERDEALKKVGLEKVTTAQLRKDLENEKSTILSAFGRVRDEAISNQSAVSDIASYSKDNTESARNSDRAITSIVRGCQETTIEFNALREWGDNLCKVYGCE